MRILYGIQGTGNGHLSRARDVVPALQMHGEVDLLVSGVQADIALPFDIKYKFKGLGFIFGKNGGVDMIETFRKAKSRRFYEEIKSLPVKDYDLVISDFEPVSSWACYRSDVPCIGLSHQAAAIGDHAPQPEKSDLLGRFILKNYCPVSHAYGFHFRAYDNHTFTPVIRNQIRDLAVETKEHYTVYLPAYDDAHLSKHFARLDFAYWDIYSKHNQVPVQGSNFKIQPINNEEFIQSLATCSGIICGAGFETPAEALFLKKKVLAIPMKNQYEQHCNAAGLKDIGVPVIKSLKSRHHETIEEWVRNGKTVPVDYPDITAQIIDWVVATHTNQTKSTFSEFIKATSASKTL
jgi:uncharacterized protein (TIGR00661 family)